MKPFSTPALNRWQIASTPHTPCCLIYQITWKKPLQFQSILESMLFSNCLPRLPVLKINYILINEAKFSLM